MEPVELSAGRLHLRPWEPRDAAEVHAICQDPAIQRWTRVPVPYRLQDAEGFVGELSPLGWAAGTDALFAVLDATTGAVLGSVGLMGIAEGSAELGYWTAPAARGQGVTTQAVGVVCRWAFAELGLQRVLWQAEVGNTASRAVAEAAGFTVEGTLRLGLTCRGRRVDCWTGSLLPGDEVRDRRAFGSWRDLSGEGLVLRQWRPDDGEASAALRRAEGEAARLAVEEDGAVVGQVVLVRCADGVAEVGWWTAPAARGRGVATRAVRLLLPWARQRVRRLEALVDVEDAASRRVAERAGFAFEGVLRQVLRPAGDRAPRDGALYALVG